MFYELTCATNRMTVQLQTLLELDSDIAESDVQQRWCRRAEDDGQIV